MLSLLFSIVPMSELENILDDALGDFEAEVKTTGETTADSNKTEEERKLPDFKAFTQVSLGVRCSLLSLDTCRCCLC